MPKDSEKSNEPKRERHRKRQRGSNCKTDKETNDSDMICGQHCDQADQVDKQTSAVRFEEINQKLDKLLALCPLIEDLKTQHYNFMSLSVCLSEMAYTTGCCSLKAQFIPLGIAFGSIRKRLK